MKKFSVNQQDYLKALMVICGYTLSGNTDVDITVAKNEMLSNPKKFLE